jgi:hypothetical protein
MEETKSIFPTLYLLSFHFDSCDVSTLSFRVYLFTKSRVFSSREQQHFLQPTCNSTNQRNSIKNRLQTKLEKHHDRLLEIWPSVLETPKQQQELGNAKLSRWSVAMLSPLSRADPTSLRPSFCPELWRWAWQPTKQLYALQ